MARLRSLISLVLLCLSVPTPIQAEGPFLYPEGKSGKGELKYVKGLPVLLVQGTPKEMGQQMAKLALRPASRLLSYPRDYLKSARLEFTWPILVSTGKGMLPQFPESYREEMEAAAKAADVDAELLVVANTMFDIQKIGGCCTLYVDADHSANHGSLLGRNLDYPTLGYINQYSLVTIQRPKGKHAFASIGFPGLIGCLSGMNDAGLALAVLESYSSSDGSPKLDVKGTPYALNFRRILEECTSIEEAEKLLRSARRTTFNNLAICDKNGGAVFEITPKNIVVRRPVKGICACTNHFRSEELATSKKCYRYDILDRSRDLSFLNIGDVAKKLHATNQGKFTLQTMIFEPATLKLHLAIGKCPTSALPLRSLELKELLKVP